MGKKGAAAVRKGTWTTEEDTLLRKCIESYGEGKWHRVPVRAGLNRCRKSCRLRWLNYLRPDIKRGYFTKDEVDLLLRLHKLLGNRWSLIAGRLPGRTANDVKNFWNTHIDKKLPAASRESKPRGTVKDMTIRPRPRILFKPLPRKQSPDQLMSRVNNLQNDDQGIKNIEPSPTPAAKSLVGCDTEIPENNLLPCSSSMPEKGDECVRWWKDLLETTRSGELLEDPFLVLDKEDDVGIQLPVLSPGFHEDNSFWKLVPLGGLCQDGENAVDVDDAWDFQKLW